MNIALMKKGLAALLILLFAVMLWFWHGFSKFRQTPFPVSETQSLVVAPGASLWSISADLKKQGLIGEPRDFVWLARWLDADQKVQAGEYRIERGLNPEGLLEKMVEGDVVQYGFTIVEGWSFRQMLTAMHQSDDLAHTLVGLSDNEIMAKLERPDLHPEGMFNPDTYHFPRGTTDLDFLRRALSAMEANLEAEWQQREEGLPYKTPYEALIMASIIEKETAVPEERDEIAGVFVRRLERRMRLQTDPTVIYGMGASFDGNIRRRDLRRDTPYNTYTRHGLPPTPIALPGVEAIRAALHPKEGESLYFVASGNGGHYFSSTLEEHNRAVRKYQIEPNKKESVQ